MHHRYAVIDLGTNTFHLLIVETNAAGIAKQLYRERIFVKLAEDGITTIGANAYQRGLDALQHFQKIIVEKKVEKVKAFGTAALRTASNGAAFSQDAKEKANISIQLISGKEEARLIHLGVLQAIELGEEKGLIMDIGGGSVEFIIADKHQVFWAESFPLGVAVLHRTFHKNEPIAAAEIKTIETHLKTTLQPLFRALKTIKVPNLIGASGTFDVLENLLPHTTQTPFSATIEVKNFPPLYEKIIKMNLEERHAAEGIPSSRADMIVVAMVLIDFIIRKVATEKIMVSAYAMKEGILWEMINRRGDNF
ncbi:MAG: phosphatase [Bacteroidota bacterium]